MNEPQWLEELDPLTLQELSQFEQPVSVEEIMVKIPDLDRERAETLRGILAANESASQLQPDLGSVALHSELSSVEVALSTAVNEPTETTEPGFEQLDISPADYSRMVATEAPLQDGGSVEIHLEENEDGFVAVVSWAPADLGVDHNHVLYRVVAADCQTKRSPDVPHALTIASTYQLSVREPIPRGASAREYRIWAYCADRMEDCVKSQPVLIGEEIVVFPPADFRLHEASGIVTCTWTTMPGHKSVKVYRRDVSQPGPTFSKSNEIKEVRSNREFMDKTVERGRTYEYLIKSCVQWGDTNIWTSQESRSATIEVSVDLETMEIVKSTVEKENSGKISTVKVTWINPPSGDVHMYFTELEPDQGLIGKEIPTADLENELLSGSLKGSNHRNIRRMFNRLEPGAEFSASLMWPKAATRVYCVPVNACNGQSKMGKPAIFSWVDGISDCTLYERVHYQLIAFRWPAGATYVRISNGSKKIDTLLEEDYKRQGGVKIVLPPERGEYTLTPSRNHAGNHTDGKPSTIVYPGREIYRYSVTHGENLTIRVTASEYTGRLHPNLRVVYLPNRLPLSAEDGTELKVNLVDSDGNWGPLQSDIAIAAIYHDRDCYWVVDLDGHTRGYVRVFFIPTPQEELSAGSQEKTLVLLDPPPQFLQLEQGGR